METGARAGGDPLVELVDVRKLLGGNAVLDGVSMTVSAQDRLAVLGPSGSGKSTLLAVLGLLTSWTCGSVRVRGEPVPRDRRPDPARHPARVAWIPQLPLYLPGRTALENVLIAQRLRFGETSPGLALDALGRVGLEGVADRNSSVLSGGELQRLAVARAVAMRPEIVLADEPTGSLDTASTRAVIDALTADADLAVVVATHDDQVARHCSRVLRLADGQLAT